MAQKASLDSNVVGTRYSEETSIGVADPAAVWRAVEPNSFSDFGGEVTTVARAPINPDRQRQKGVLTDLDASGGFNVDFIPAALEDLLQGFMFANLQPKTEFGDGAGVITNVDGTAEEYDAASGLDAFAAGQLVFASGFTNSANNGLKRVTAAAATALTVAEDLIDEAAPPAAARLVEVGFQGAAGDIDVDATGTLPAITSTVLDFTTLGIAPGEYLHLGGDGAAFQFSNAVNNGFKRVFSVAANRVEFDKSDSTMVDEASAAETIQLFFGRVLKNRTGSDIVRRTYQIERTLGAPDDTLPAEVQAEYIKGCIANELELNVPSADLLKADLTFQGTGQDLIDGPTALKTGTRPAIDKAEGLNTSSDVPRINMHLVTPGVEAPTPLFTFVQELTLSINNGATPNKAVGRLGAFEVTVGDFVVSGSVNAYFGNVSSIQAVQDNASVTLDAHFVKANSGWSFDLPLLTLGDGRVNVEKDEPQLIPLSYDAATGCTVSTDLDHTLLMIFWDYLPDLAG